MKLSKQESVKREREERLLWLADQPDICISNPILQLIVLFLSSFALYCCDKHHY